MATRGEFFSGHRCACTGNEVNANLNLEDNQPAPKAKQKYTAKLKPLKDAYTNYINSKSERRKLEKSRQQYFPESVTPGVF